METSSHDSVPILPCKNIKHPHAGAETFSQIPEGGPVGKVLEVKKANYVLCMLVVPPPSGLTLIDLTGLQCIDAFLVIGVLVTMSLRAMFLGYKKRDSCVSTRARPQALDLLQ